MTQQTGEPHKKLQQNTVLYNQYIWNSSDEYWFFIYQQYLHKKSCLAFMNVLRSIKNVRGLVCW